MIKTAMEVYQHVYKTGKLSIPKDWQITRNLYWFEAFKNQKVIPNYWVFSNIVKVALEVQKVRDIIGLPFVINSWYRDPMYNKEVSNATLSCHTFGLAIDFVVRGMKSDDVRKIILQNKLSLRLEPNVSWVHADRGHPFIANGARFGLIDM